ncbi:MULTISPECIES: CDP-alcohol phosphatidyltransferase family protein [Flavobacterium]|uniref:CDP-alcohol phosphatidyltransferase family protein n=1 Tax=Flavobacterium jumunjinense TaxID=998845 RepID=A0ABV5GJ24_9FLAO|nr:MULTISPECIES: CDP-alcohol phosphatidyltransferase family protein [Flavobacterium]
MKRFIPNTFTMMNLLSGLLALISIFNGFYDHAFLFVCLGIFFDFWDGFLARKLNVSSELGVQLDSLADMVTSGVVPGLMMFKLLENIQLNDSNYMVTEETAYMGFVPYLGFIVTLASCYRLAKFNIDTRQTESFIGLPTPANTLLLMSIPMIQYVDSYEWLLEALNNPYILVVIILVSAYLLNAEIPLFSLKFKKLDWENAKTQIIFLVYSSILLFVLAFTAIPVIIFSYIIFSLILNTTSKK